MPRAGRAAAKHQQSVAVLDAAAAEASVARWANGMAPQPFGDTAVDCLGLGLGTRQATVEFDDAGPLGEVVLPVLSGPLAIAGPQQGDQLCLVKQEQVKHARRRWGVCLEHEGLAVDSNANASLVGSLEGLTRAHTFPVQGPLLSPELRASVASASSAPASALYDMGSARTLGWVSSTEPSAPDDTVRRRCEAKSLRELGIVRSADGADGCWSTISAGTASPVLEMRIVRVRARPTRSKPISNPILR